MNIILGLILVVVGALLTIKSETFYRITGPIGWAERYLGTEGGTRLFFKFLGVLVILLGFTVMVGLWNTLLSATLGKMFGL